MYILLKENGEVDPEWFKRLRTRTVGYYFNLETAKKAVEEDWAGFDEAGYYNFIIIEEMREGLYPSADVEEKEWWYYHNSNIGKWVPCDRPKTERLEGVVGFGVG